MARAIGWGDTMQDATQSEPLTEWRGTPHERYEWLDRARGVVVLMYVISIILAAVKGNVLLGEPPLGPTYLNHGYAYFNGYPAIITLIDAGQMMFIFIVGFAGYIAFQSRLEKRGAVAAWRYAGRRVAGLYALSILGETVILPLTGDERHWNLALYNGVLSRIAIGALVAYLAVYFIRNANRRMAVSVAMLIVHAFLFASYAFDRNPWFDDILQLPPFPFGVWSMAACAVAGTAFSEWLLRDPSAIQEAFRDRVVPAGTMSFVAAYCMEWLQPAEHQDVTAGLALLAIGLSAHMVATAYAFQTFGWGSRILRMMGRNLLLLFVITAIGVDMYVRFVVSTLSPMHPYVALALVGVLPIAAIMWIATLLDKKNIVIRV
ncbi:MAG: hypothetical protein K1Y02_18530 [Candidatus Hydrogenedentes bacterium]|nr:hypothetical protein [Candidatus Hydrogenedentota bacterium]